MFLSPQVGARLLVFHRKWAQITGDQWVLETLQQGLRMEFLYQPFQRLKETFVPKNGLQESVILEEINTLLGKHVIESVPRNEINQGFYSTIFVVPKRQGGLRPILNLRPLNQMIIPKHFKMETLRSILKGLRKGDYAITLDLTDAYFHIPIHPQFKQFLRFRFLGKSYQFRAMPFGLRSAPRVFTKIMAVIGAYLRQKLMYIFMYLDDWLMINANKTLLESQLQCLLKLLKSLGLIVNVKKSVLVPTQNLEYLGAHFNLEIGIVTPTEKRFHSIQEIILNLIDSSSTQAVVLLRLLGIMASCIYLIPMGRLHMRPIQLYLLAWWRPNIQPLNHEIPVKPSLIQHLKWWENRQNVFQGMPLEDPVCQMTLLTDASETGWGAHLDQWQTAGTWPPEYKMKHINWLELKAVFLALTEALHLVKNKTILVRSDNATVISYINKQGGTHSAELCYLTWDLYQWCIQNQVLIRAAHIPGRKNTLADALSRGKCQTRMTEWTLDNTVVNLIFHQMGTPTVDLFATYQNNKLPVYCSPVPDVNALQIDALAFNWTGMFAYAFPPPILIPRVLQKIREEKCVVILIAPMWPRQSWYPQILEMLIELPIKLPNVPNLLSQILHNFQVYHQNPEILNLVAWKLSNSTINQKDFLKELQQLWQMPEKHQLKQFMTQDSEFISAGVKNGILIPLRQLYLT